MFSIMSRCAIETIFQVGRRSRSKVGQKSRSCGLDMLSLGNHLVFFCYPGSRMLYCAPGYNGSECRDKVADDDYCLRHGCENSTYCKVGNVDDGGFYNCNDKLARYFFLT